MNILEKIGEESIKHLVGVVFALIGLLLFALWSAIPKTVWAAIDSKVPKTAVWAALGIFAITAVLLVAYITYLKKRTIRTLNTESTMLRKSLQESETARASLESQNQALSSRQSALRQQLAGTNSQLKQPEPPTSLEDAQLRILVLLFEEDGMWDRHIAESMNMKPQQAEYHVRALEDSGHISSNQLTSGYPATYSLTQKGRECLKQQGYF